MSYDQLYDTNELIKQISQGNEFAFRQLFQQYHNKLYNYILQITGSKESAEDTVQEVFLKIWTRRNKLIDIQNLNAYLYRMCYNQALNGLRRVSTEVLLKAALETKPEKANVTPEDTLLNKEIKQIINQAIDTLTPQQKIVFNMSREEGLKQEEIARQLNISITTVKKHLTNALNHLRKIITDDPGSKTLAIFSFFLLR